MFEQAAEKDLLNAQFCLGLCYENGYGVGQSIDQAKEWYIKAADQGNINAQNSLGWLYYEQENCSKTIEWFMEAGIENGYKYSQYGMGECFYNGYGVGQDYKQARLWYKQAAYWFKESANKGYDYSQFMLGMCYFEGRGVEEDQEQALYWFECAANQNNAIAQNWLGKCYENGWGVDIDTAKADEYYQLAKANGYKES